MVLTYVTLDPDWRTIFKGDKISLTCNVVYSTGWKKENFYWYKDNQELHKYEQTFHITSAKMTDSGDYRCRTTSSNKSDPVYLDVSNDWLILQVPSYIYEGDMLTLNCRGWNEFFSNRVAIYKDNRIIERMGYYMDTTGTGTYKCARKLILDVHMSKGISVRVNELFSVPVLKLTRPLISEGDDMTLTCDTALAPQRWTTTLQFAFYRNEQKLQKLSPNHEYRVSSAQLEHSGKYSCEVYTLLGTVRKMSDTLNIQVQELFRTPVMQVFPSATGGKGQQVVLRCVTTSPTGIDLLYSFLKDAHIVRGYTANNTYLLPPAGEDHSGNYQCSSKSANRNVLKYSKDVYITEKVGINQPQLTLIPERVVVGDEITLRCESSEDIFPRHYRFYHNGTILGDVTDYQKRTVEIRQIIKSVTMTGPYYCDCRKDMLSRTRLSGAIHLFVMDPVANISITMEREAEDFVFGEPVTFTCSVQRGTSPSFIWFHNEEVVEQRSMFYQLKDNQKRLYIDSLQIHHRGTYQCKATNKLSPNRTFSVLSAPRNINVLEPSPTEIVLLGESNTLIIVLGVVLSTILTAVLGFMYRQKMASLLRSCALQPPKTERTKGQARITQNPANGTRESSSDIGLEDYSNIPSRSHVDGEDVCYGHISINPASSHPHKVNEELSVTYSAVKFSQSPMDPQTTQETPDCTDLYKNFNAKRLQS